VLAPVLLQHRAHSQAGLATSDDDRVMVVSHPWLQNGAGNGHERIALAPQCQIMSSVTRVTTRLPEDSDEQRVPQS
jgi:hypothetical protein